MGRLIGRLRPASPVIRVNLGVELLLKREREEGSGGSHKEWAARDVVHYLRSIHGLGTRRRRLLLSSSGNTAQAIAAQTGHMGIELFVVADALSPRLQLEKLRRFPHVRLIVVDEPDRQVRIWPLGAGH